MKVTALIAIGRVSEMEERGWEYIGPPDGDDAEWAVLMRGPNPDFINWHDHPEEDAA